MLKLKVPEQKDILLRNLRKKVRQELVSAFDDLKSVIVKSNWEVLSKFEQSEVIKLKPKFRTQGSFAYGTLVMPHWRSQEIDIDDGVYFPMTMVKSNPVMMHNVIFTVLDDVLKSIADKHDWTVIKKPTCSRLVTKSGAHIDVPAYAMPDQRFAQLKNAMESLTSSLSKDDRDFDRELIDSLEANEVNLVHREKGYIKSDPALIREWVNDCKRDYKQPFFNLCMIVKGWRDFQWEKGGPSSIALMVAVYHVFCSEEIPDNLDEALLKVSKRLPLLLSNRLEHPKLSGEYIYIPSESEASEVREKAILFSQSLENAIIYSGTRENCIGHFKECLGFRVPNTPDAVEDYRCDFKPKAYSNHKPAIVVNPITGNTRAG